MNFGEKILGILGEKFCSNILELTSMHTHIQGAELGHKRKKNYYSILKDAVFENMEKMTYSLFYTNKVNIS